MKQTGVTLLLFAAGFCVGYLGFCALPGMAIKLEASPSAYFLAQLAHMWPLKTAAGVAAGLLPAVIYRLGRRRNRTKVTK